ncbi:hypothetical protein B0H15DRAFT_823972 [Mycena belliarum]|uniref:Mitochondrial zinc maintenance protein 1, mitochondrial n=1 Tax=Mycena belliarum TaxID=1033014 RepID=A0AAD6UGC0_9AGAR|nr:hypothetical protein B0H15DRAFT_823972 [Mycena belliae]
MISNDLRASARSAYRLLLRASSATFAGDEPVLRAFRAKIRQDAIAARGITDPALYERHNTLGKEIATIVRTNLVQATKVNGADPNTWKVRITEDTELGSNGTIKNPPVAETSRRARKNERDDRISLETPAPDSDAARKPPTFYSNLKKAHKDRVVPEVKEEDLDESFVRGSGPGGQSVNKTEVWAGNPDPH